MSGAGLPTVEEVRERLMVPLHDDERRNLVTLYQALLDQHDVRLRTPILGSLPPEEEATIQAASHREHYEHLKAPRDLVEEADYERPDWADVEQQEDSLSSIQEKIDYLENLLNRDEQLVKEGLFEGLVTAEPFMPPFRVFLGLWIVYLRKCRDTGIPALLKAATMISQRRDWYLPDSVPEDVREQVFNVAEELRNKVLKP